MKKSYSMIRVQNYMTFCTSKSQLSQVSSILPIELLKKTYGFKALKILSKIGGYSTQYYSAIVDDDKKIIIKHYHSLDIHKVKKIVDVTNVISQFDLKAPLLIHTSDGQFYKSFDEGHIIIYYKIQGRILHANDFNNTSLNSTGTYLAKLHEISTSSKLLLPSTINLLKSQHEIEQSVKSVQDIIRAKPKGSSIDNITNKLIDMKLNMLSEFIRYDHFLSHLLSQQKLIHGDFHNENLLFDDRDNIAGILDFEESHYGHPMEDIMHFVELGCCNMGHNEANFQKARCFFSSYSKINKLTPEEIELGLHLYLYKISSSFFLENKLYDSSSDELITLIERDIKSLEYFATHSNQFIERFFEFSDHYE